MLTKPSRYIFAIQLLRWKNHLFRKHIISIFVDNGVLDAELITDAAIIVDLDHALAATDPDARRLYAIELMMTRLRYREEYLRYRELLEMLQIVKEPGKDLGVFSRTNVLKEMHEVEQAVLTREHVIDT